MSGSLTAGGGPYDRQDMANHTMAACQFLEHLSSGDFAKAAASFDSTMSTQMPADQLKAGWEQVERIGGKFQEPMETSVQPIEGQPGYQIVHMTLRFDTQTIQSYLVYDQAGKVAGLGFAAS
jgi:hypothetical protein